MSESPFLYATLTNGLRCVAKQAQIPVEHCGVVVNAGSRDELPHLYGLAHFVEHTIFKGTSRHRASYIRDRLEVIGGELNAYTTKEETVVYSTAPAGHLDRAVALMAEMVADSQFPDSELSREKLVVAEEIDTYLDTPSEAVFDDFEELIYAGSPLAHNILGAEATLRELTGADCRRYLHERFTPGNMVFFYYGPEAPGRAIAKAERYFGTLNRPDCPLSRHTPSVNPSFNKTTQKADSFQAHTIMGARIPGLLSDQRFSIALLANIIGGPGMNSLLYVALRERRGLVYSVEASTSLMSDNGLLTIYFGCDPADADRCARLVSRTITRLAEKELSTRQLNAAKRQFIGQLTVGSVNTEQIAISMGRSTLYRGSAMSLSDTVNSIHELSATDLRTKATTLLPLSRLTLR